MLIRVFEIADTEAVVALWQSCGLVAPQNNPRTDIARKMKVNPELFLVGCIESEVVGTVMGGYEGHRGWINYLATHPNHQRSGIASQLMSAVEMRILAMGCPKINLQIRSSNAAVMGFYQSMGYVADDVVGMGKRLEQDS